MGSGKESGMLARSDFSHIRRRSQARTTFRKSPQQANFPCSVTGSTLEGRSVIEDAREHKQNMLADEASVITTEFGFRLGPT